MKFSIFKIYTYIYIYIYIYMLLERVNVLDALESMPPPLAQLSVLTSLEKQLSISNESGFANASNWLESNKSKAGKISSFLV